MLGIADHRFDSHEPRRDRDRPLPRFPESESPGANGRPEKRASTRRNGRQVVQFGQFVRASTVVDRRDDPVESRDAVRGQPIIHHSRDGVSASVHGRDPGRRQAGIGQRAVGVVRVLVRGCPAAEIHQQKMRYKGRPSPPSSLFYPTEFGFGEASPRGVIRLALAAAFPAAGRSGIPARRSGTPRHRVDMLLWRRGERNNQTNECVFVPTNRRCVIFSAP